ncbi:hypothetical protein [Reichenbachiella sp.]|uniref:hypothetical protein n=1 Tax=Reichenbachiella sp. TaxID=2184521 RepID=UPI003298C7BF
MRLAFLIITIIFFSSLDLRACSCSIPWNDSFSKTAKASEFVALVKVISYDSFLKREFSNEEEKIPYSMTVEIVKKYKGQESRKRITIFGDNGILCRPYLDNFEINGYYLVSPNPLDNSVNTEYDFFVCRTEYLKVDIESNMAYGNYSMIRDQIDLKTFENKLESGDCDFVIIGSIGGLTILIMIILKRNRKRNANKMYSL